MPKRMQLIVGAAALVGATLTAINVMHKKKEKKKKETTGVDFKIDSWY